MKIKRGEKLWNDGGEVSAAAHKAILAPLEKAGVYIDIDTNDDAVDRELQGVIFDVLTDAAEETPEIQWCGGKGLQLTYYFAALDQSKKCSLGKAVYDCLMEYADEERSFDVVKDKLRATVERAIRKAEKAQKGKKQCNR